MKSLRLTDFRDLDLMMAVAGNGGITSQELADKLGMEGALQHVSVRCSWMRRFGIFDRDEVTGAWFLTDGGQRVLDAKVRAAQASSLEKVPDEAMVEVMAHVTSRYRLGDPVVATLLRREFQYGTAPGVRR